MFHHKNGPAEKSEKSPKGGGKVEKIPAKPDKEDKGQKNDNSKGPTSWNGEESKKKLLLGINENKATVGLRAQV